MGSYGSSVNIHLLSLTSNPVSKSTSNLVSKSTSWEERVFSQLHSLQLPHICTQLNNFWRYYFCTQFFRPFQVFSYYFWVWSDMFCILQTLVLFSQHLTLVTWLGYKATLVLLTCCSLGSTDALYWSYYCSAQSLHTTLYYCVLCANLYCITDTGLLGLQSVGITRCGKCYYIGTFIKLLL